MKYTAILIMIIFVAACGGNGDHDRHAGHQEAHDYDGHVHQQQGGAEGMVSDRQPDHPLEEPAAGLFDAVLGDYLALSGVLVESDASAAAEAAGRLGSSVEELSQAGFDGPVRDQAAAWIAVLQARSQEIAGESDVEEQRRSYLDLSEIMIAMVETFGHQKGQLYHQRCPMVNGGNGDWLSAQERIMNPYHGDRMLHCGSTVRTL
jgi:hypothetical protein